MKTYSQLLDEKSRIDHELQRDRAVLREVMAQAHEKKRYAPVKQFNDLKLRISRLGQTSQKLQAEIAVARIREHEASLSINDCFREVAKKYLPEDKYVFLAEEAQILKRSRRIETY